MRREAVTQKSKTDRMVKDIRRKTRKKHSSEDKIRIVPSRQLSSVAEHVYIYNYIYTHIL